MYKYLLLILLVFTLKLGYNQPYTNYKPINVLPININNSTLYMPFFPYNVKIGDTLGVNTLYIYTVPLSTSDTVLVKDGFNISYKIGGATGATGVTGPTGGT